MHLKFLYLFLCFGDAFAMLINTRACLCLSDEEAEERNLVIQGNMMMMITQLKNKQQSLLLYLLHVYIYALCVVFMYELP